MRLPGNVSSLKPHEMRPQNETMERHAGKGPRDEALGWNPKTKCSKVFKTGLECGIFFPHLSRQTGIAFVVAQHNPR